MNTVKLQSAIAAFIRDQKTNAAYYADNWEERKERKAFYQSFTKDISKIATLKQKVRG